MLSDKIDVVSDIFTALRLRSELYFEADIRGDFAVRLDAEDGHVRFHLVRHGTCGIALDGSDVIQELEEGDLVIVPHGTAQVLGSGAAVDVVDVGVLIDRAEWDGHRLSTGSGQRRTNLLCGFCRFDTGRKHPVLDTLPALMIVRPQNLGAEPWMSAALRTLAMEADLAGPGSTGIMSRLLEVVLAQSIRRETSRAGTDRAGFAAALADDRIAAALQAIHTGYDAALTVDGLAERAGMSRAAFSRHFTRLVGQAPFAYLTFWRMNRARSLLEQTRLDMTEIAERCGYASVPSFSARFKSVVGTGPGAYRRTYIKGTRTD